MLHVFQCNVIIMLPDKVNEPKNHIQSLVFVNYLIEYVFSANPIQQLDCHTDFNNKHIALYNKMTIVCQDCKYLPENELKQLCELVCDLLLEESNIQPVSR